jgi:small GTP-binding protein
MGTIKEEIERLEKEIKDTPYNKATEMHIGKLKAKVAKLKDQLEKQAAKKTGGGKGYGVKKSGHATVAIVGFPSVGKSTILNAITSADSRVGEYEFTTLTVVPGIMKYKGAEIQILDLPGIIKGASRGKGRGREILSILRSADLMMFVLDVFDTKLHVLVEELWDVGIRLNQSPPNLVITKRDRGGIDVQTTVKLTQIEEETVKSIVDGYGYINADVILRTDITMDQLIDHLSGNRIYAPALVVLNKTDLVSREYIRVAQERLKGWDVIPVSGKNEKGMAKLKKKIHSKFKFIRIYLKPQGKEADMVEPLVIKENSTIGSVCDYLHRDFRRKFRYAKVWGKSVKYDAQTVGIGHVLRDGDVLSIIVRKS